MSGHARLFAHGNAIHAPSVVARRRLFWDLTVKHIRRDERRTLGHLSAPAELACGDERFPRGARSGARKPKLGRGKKVNKI